MPVDTSKMIMEAFAQLISEKQAERITIKEIVERCGISRKTFYYHFDDIYDLTDRMLEHSLEKFYQQSKDAEELEEVIDGFADFVIQSRGLIRRVMETEQWDRVADRVFNRMQLYFKRMAEKATGSCGERGSGPDTDIGREFFLYGILGILTQRIFNSKEEKEKVVREVCSLIRELSRSMGILIK